MWYSTDLKVKDVLPSRSREQGYDITLSPELYASEKQHNASTDPEGLPEASLSQQRTSLFTMTGAATQWWIIRSLRYIVPWMPPCL